jgi:hypothetical protein
MHRKLRIAFVSGHACIRCQKEAIPLSGNGHEVFMLAGKIPPGYEYYQNFILAPGINHYLDAISALSPVVDLFHVHNEPSWFVTAIKERSDKPVVLDVHDSYLARMTPEESAELQEKGIKAWRVMSEERNNFQLADALVFPGEKFANLVCGEFRLDQPRLILPSYLPRSFYIYHSGSWYGGMVYEGRVDLKSYYQKDPKNLGFKYCDYEDFAGQMKSLGMDFHIYGPSTDNEEFQKIYEPLCHLHGAFPFEVLMKEVAKHDWGLVGNVFPSAEWNIAFPNKLFDYIGASVPVVCINAPEVGKFVTKYGIGIEVDSLEDLRTRWAEHRTCRANLVKHRQKWVMEAHIHKLEELYEKAIEDKRVRDFPSP